MNSAMTLDAIRDFLNDKIAEADVLMQKEESFENEVYVSPYVEVCYMPHKNFLPKEFQVPYILVMMDEENDDGNEDDYSIRLVFGAFGGGYYLDENDNPTTIPDAKGYIDLLNLMDKVKQWLLTTSVIKEKTVVRKPYKKGMYDEENTWPYWYGYSTFIASGIVENHLIRDDW